MASPSQIFVEWEPSFRVFVSKKEVTQLRGKTLGLLQFLVEHRSSWVSRSMLESKFWPGVPRKNAQLSLRQALHAISRHLGEACPLTANRTHVYCRSSQVYISRKSGVWAANHFWLVKSRNTDASPSEQREQILAAYRREPLWRFIPFIQQASTNLDSPRENQRLAKFFLAFSYNETCRPKLAISTAQELLSDSKNQEELAAAKHALGGILWHSGHFEAGLAKLWDAQKDAEQDPAHQVHILTNIAIGYYEAQDPDGMIYAHALAAKTLRLMEDNQHSLVLDYVEALDAISRKQPQQAAAKLGHLVRASNSESPRIKVYLLEALALASRNIGDTVTANDSIAEARALREIFGMMPSAVELRRLRRFRNPKP